VFTLDDNQKFDYGIFIVHLCEHSNRLSLSISASKAARVHYYVTSHAEAPTTWSVDCVNQMSSEANTRQKHFVIYYYSDVAGDIGRDTTTGI